MTSAPTILHGDCLQMMAQLADGSVDAVVTDPPYGLSFMGKRWDYDVPAVAVWAECLRVLKPGGHLLAFAGTRTQHRMAVRIEDAGFEIRDMIAWVYGSGFPKSLDVSKAIDKARTEDVEPVRVVCRAVRAAMDANALKSRDLTQHFGDCHPRLIDHWAARDTDSQPALPTWEQWETLREVLGINASHDAEVWRLNGRKGQPGDAWQNAEVIGTRESGDPRAWYRQVERGDGIVEIRQATEAARQWSGWGTALKPALEPITVARKPLAGTVAENVLAHGTGALNIDGCRVGDFQNTTPSGVDRRNAKLAELGYRPGEYEMGEKAPDTPPGRWPANLIHDGSEEVVGLLPDTKSGSRKAGRHVVAGGANAYAGWWREGDMPEIVGDSGSAARFFYCAKASKADREIGNNHPTVKPTALMRYLCRLVTPPGGVVLDPFMGSGSTGKAAALEGFRFVGIEREAEYVEIARARIASVDAAQNQFQMERRR